MKDDYLVPLATPCVYYDESFLSTEESNTAYEDLLQNTKWEKTAKINRWVSLYEETNQDPESITNGATNIARSEDPSDIASRAKNLKVNNESNAINPISGPTAEATTTSVDYKYRDAAGATVMGFNDTINFIRKRAEEWYNIHNQHPQYSSDDETKHDAQSAHSSSTTPTNPVKFNVCLLNFYENGQQRIGWHSDREEIGRTTPIASISLGATRNFQLRSKANGMKDRIELSVTNGSLVVMENRCQEEYVHCLPKDGSVLEGRINLTFRCKSEGKQSEGEKEHERRDFWLQDLQKEVDKVDAQTRDGSQHRVDDDGCDLSTYVFGDNIDTNVELFDTHNITTNDDQGVIYMMSTNIGSEIYCAAEVTEAVNHVDITHDWNVVARPFGIAGYVSCSLSLDGHESDDEDSHHECLSDNSSAGPQLESKLLQLRSVHNIIQYHDHFNLQDVVSTTATDEDADIKKKIQAIDGEALYQFYKHRLMDGTASISTFTSTNQPSTFRVTCERIGGPHSFQSTQVEFEVGGALAEFYESRGVTPKMTNYDRNIRVDILHTDVIVGTQINVDDLSKGRHFIKFRNPVTIKTNLAYCMIRCAGLTPGQMVLDPFCGSGTILLEALEMFEKQVKCIGLEVNKRAARGATENAVAEGIGEDRCVIHACDARNLRRFVDDESVDCIVSNLPWGVMTGEKNVNDLQTLYEIFLRLSWYVLKPNGRIVLLVLRGLQLTRILRKLGGRYRILRCQVIRTTNNLPCLIVVEKLPVDILNLDIKRQLANMSSYVNFSSEMYHAIHNESISDQATPSRQDMKDARLEKDRQKIGRIEPEW